MTITMLVRVKGGAGSGNWGHVGRPGLVGGSGGSGGGIKLGVGKAGYDPNHPSTQKVADLLDKDYDYFTVSQEQADEWGKEHGDYNVTGPIGDWNTADTDIRDRAKREITKELSQRTGIPEEDVANFIAQWAKSSNDTDMRSLSMQRDAAEELGLELSKWQQNSIDDLMSNPAYGKTRKSQILPSDQQRQLIRAMYDNTQEQLAAQGFKPDDMVQLYRGTGVAAGTDFDWEVGATIDYQGNAIESWSVSKDVADGFAGGVGEGNGYTLSMEVPVRNIIGTARSGFGCLTEGEIIVAGNVPDQQAEIVGMFDFD